MTEVTGFGEHASWTGVLDSDRSAWLERRRSMVTASEMPMILNESAWGDAFSVFIAKASPVPDDPPTIESPMFWGKMLELPICQAVAKFEKWVLVRPGGALLESRAHPGIGATLDAEIIRTEGGPLEPYEGKTTRFDEGWDEDEQTLPLAALVQVQTQLLVTGAPSAYVFGLVSGCKPKRIVVQAKPEFFPVLVAAANAFLDLVRRAEPPPVTARSGNALAELFPESNGGRVMLPRQALEWTADYQELLKQEKTIKAAKAEIANKVKLLMGSASYGELPEDVNGVGRWEWSTRASYRVEAYTVAQSRPLFQRKGKDDRFVAPPVDMDRILKMSAEEHQAAADEPLALPEPQPSLDFTGKDLAERHGVRTLIRQAEAPKERVRFGRRKK